MLIPDAATKRGIGRRQTRRIRNGMDESEAGKKKNVATCVERTVTLTRSAHSFQYPLLLPRLDLPGIQRMVGSTYKNSPHVVVHDTPSNVFVCTKLSILCM